MFFHSAMLRWFTVRKDLAIWHEEPLSRLSAFPHKSLCVANSGLCNADSDAEGEIIMFTREIIRNNTMISARPARALSFSHAALHHGNELKCVPHVQHDYYSSFDQCC